jgi:sorting nexin-1/2
MDGFDDLLEPSRRALEENPFEDPFSKRSSSPDPWSSYSHPVVTTFGQTESLNTEPEPTSGTTPTGSFVTADQDDRPDHANLPGPSDPLDASAPDAEEEHVDHRPGFLESLPPGFSEIETIRPTIPEELEPTIPASAFHEPEPSHSRASTSTQALSSASSPSMVSRTPSAGAFARATSPLEPTASLSIGRSFASLTLGGETAGGWQEPATAGTHKSTQGLSEDSDDDKPIGQTIRPSESSMPVSRCTLQVLRCNDCCIDIASCFDLTNGKRTSASVCHIC